MSLTSLAISAATKSEAPLADVQRDAAGGDAASATEKWGKLVEYIPGEVVTLFLAALAAREALSQWVGLTTIHIYLIMLGLTPVLFLLLFLGTRRQAGKSKKELFKGLTVWGLAAPMIAFAAWGLVVPDVIQSDESYVEPLLALMATVVTIFLPVLGRVFEKPSST